MSPRHISKEEFATMQAKVRGGVDSDTQGRRGASRGSMPLTTGAFREPVAGANPAPSPSVQSFFVPGPLPGANDIIRKHHMVYSQLKKTWGGRVQFEIVLAGILPVSYCEIEFVWHEKHDRRDDDNIMFGQKFVLDALKHAGIIPDDRRKFVKRLIHSVVVYPPGPGVQVTIREVL